MQERTISLTSFAKENSVLGYQGCGTRSFAMLLLNHARELQTLDHLLTWKEDCIVTILAFIMFVVCLGKGSESRLCVFVFCVMVCRARRGKHERFVLFRFGFSSVDSATHLCVKRPILLESRWSESCLSASSIHKLSIFFHLGGLFVRSCVVFFLCVCMSVCVSHHRDQPAKFVLVACGGSLGIWFGMLVVVSQWCVPLSVSNVLCSCSANTVAVLQKQVLNLCFSPHAQVYRRVISAPEGF